MKKGFTLMELIATLIILSIIGLIVTPNILVSIRDYKEQVYENNINAIENAAKSWVADHVNDTHFPTDESFSLLVTIDELINDNYLDEKVSDLINGGHFDDEDHETYVIINCINIVDKITGEVKNSKYTYDAYISDDNFIQEATIKYAKANNINSNTSITVSDLKEEYIKENIFHTDWYVNTTLKVKKTISNSKEITISYNGSEYKVAIK